MKALQELLFGSTASNRYTLLRHREDETYLRRSVQRKDTQLLVMVIILAGVISFLVLGYVHIHIKKVPLSC